MASQQFMEAGDDDDTAALFHSYPCAVYYVQSPSATSHYANSTSDATEAGAGRHHSSTGSHGSGREVEEAAAAAAAAHRLTLSRYSSSRGSKITAFELNELDHDGFGLKVCAAGTAAGSLEEDEEMLGGRRKKMRGLAKLVVLDTRAPFYCVMLQLSWRLLGSLGLALLVFFLATKPPAPEVAVKIIRFRQFSLGEGLDETGVATKVLSCNCSVDLQVDNKSKFFDLHIHPPILELGFGPLQFPSSESEAYYVEASSHSVKRFYVGVKKKAVYGAGRSMEDLLDSGKELPFMIRVNFKSTYRVILDLLKINHTHRHDCLIILHAIYDYDLRLVKLFNSTCFHH